IEQKRKKFEFEAHVANNLIHDAVEMVRLIAGKNDIHILEEHLPKDAVVWCDSEAVSQVLSNLLDNAIKYTPAGGQITVGAHPAAGGPVPRGPPSGRQRHRVLRARHRHRNSRRGPAAPVRALLSRG